MDIFYGIIKNIIIYLILLTLIMNLLGNSSFKKYIRVFTGMLLILLVISPVLNALKLSGKFDIYFEANQFETESQNFKAEMELMDQSQKEVMVNEYKDAVNSQIEMILQQQKLYCISSEAVINENRESSTFGAVEQISVVASHFEPEEKKKEYSDVGTVEIKKIKVSSEATEQLYRQISDYEKREKGTVKEETAVKHVKKALSDFYHLEEDNINISIQE